MTSHDKTQVLISGAGPVGLYTALLLTEFGISCRIIDRTPRTNVHSYALALHPRSFDLLRRAGVEKDLLARGHKVDRISVWEGSEQRGVVDLSSCGAEVPFVLVLPQSDLEDVLERKLRSLGVAIQWSKELVDLREGGAELCCSVANVVDVLQGYPVLRMERMRGSTGDLRCDYLVGADGFHSTVRNLIGGEYRSLAPAEHYSVFEFHTTALEMGGEMRICLEGDLASAFWPMEKGACRWSFQRATSDEAERTTLQDFHRLVMERAPWFAPVPTDVRWTSPAHFEPRISSTFGRGRVYLVGDAAHIATPIGVQSMNEGLHEAHELALALATALGAGRSRLGLERYAAQRLDFWTRYYSEGGVVQGHDDEWLAARLGRLRRSLPLGGDALSTALVQLERQHV